MRKSQFFSGSAALILAAALSAQTATTAPAESSHGIDRQAMDPSASPCRDFFEYADGGWIKTHPVPPEYSRWGTFNELQDRNQEVLRGILEKAAKMSDALPGSDERKIGDYYSSCMDEPAIEAAGAKPLEPELDRIEAISDRKGLEAEIARLQTMGVRAAFNFGSEQDRKASDQVIAGARQGGLGLPDRDYYTKTDEPSKKIREEYVAHVAKMLELSGVSADRASDDAGKIMALETRLAEASLTRVERRDPDRTYHRKTVAELSAATPAFAWEEYFRAIDAPKIPAVNLAEPEFFSALDRALAEVPLPTWKSYLRWQLLNAAAPALSSKFVDADFDFYEKTLQGTEKLKPRWKRCVEFADGDLGFALGKFYVAQVFPPEAKASADRMVHNLIAALRNDIRTLPWMSPETRKAALAKLDAFTPKIGYPDKWRDYSAYAVTRGPFVRNRLAGERFEFHRDLEKIGKPVDRTEWGMTPPTVNAYYNPLKNEIVFPAGILQPPFFDAKADDAVNYGGIGSVIGHEMTHGFDDQGRKFDAHGNLSNWWTDQDLKNYKERAACVEKQFDGYEVEPGLQENGKLVLGESIADLGGLTIAYKAYHTSLDGRPAPEVDGLSGDQRFFLSWARVWRQTIRPEEARRRVVIDPHPLGRFRAIGAPSNMPAFAAAFSCAPNAPMVRTVRCEIW
jgi:putative endopeptidase